MTTEEMRRHDNSGYALLKYHIVVQFLNNNPCKLILLYT